MLGFKALSKLHQLKYREQYGCFLIEGKRSVQEAVESPVETLQLIASHQFVQQQPEYCHQPLIKKFFERDLVLLMDQGELAKLSSTSTPQGIAAVVRTPQSSIDTLLSQRRLAILEDIRDPGNLGTMIRTADWFGVGGLLLIKGANPFGPKVVRSSMGSVLHVPIVISTDYQKEIEQFKAQGFQIVVTRPELAQAKVVRAPEAEKMAVVFGNEAHGTSPKVDQLADASFSIPRYGKAESLNVAVSFGIAMYEVMK